MRKTLTGWNRPKRRRNSDARVPCRPNSFSPSPLLAPWYLLVLYHLSWCCIYPFIPSPHPTPTYHISREPHEQPQNQFPHHAIGQKQFPFTEDEAQVRRERFTTYVRCPGPDMLLLFLISYGVCVRNIHVSAQLCARSGKTERNRSRGKWISAFIALFLFTFFLTQCSVWEWLFIKRIQSNLALWNLKLVMTSCQYKYELKQQK